MPAKNDRLTVTVTQLEIATRPTHSPAPAPMLPQPISLIRVHAPTPSYYRYLYDTVGEPGLWYERSQLDADALKAVIQDERIALYVLSYGGVPAGFAELDMRPENTVRRRDTLLAYFGLVPDFIGRGLGRFFLSSIIDIAWQRPDIDRLVVRTCTLDHPAALSLYQKCGFSATRQQTTTILDPRKTGLLPPDAGPVKI
jgi:GNAT superfamily N-acetyltransferase